LEELHRRTLEQLEKAQIPLHKVKLEADEHRINRHSKIEQEKEFLISATSITLEQLIKV
jgi:hypothetical protein